MSDHPFSIHPRRKPFSTASSSAATMCVDHGGGQVAVTQRLLHQPDILGLAVKINGEGVAQGVGANMFPPRDARLLGVTLDHRSEVARVKAGCAVLSVALTPYKETW